MTTQFRLALAAGLAATAALPPLAAQHTSLQTGVFQFYYAVRHYNLITEQAHNITAGQDTLGPAAIGGNVNFNNTSFKYAQNVAPANDTHAPTFGYGPRSSVSDPTLMVNGALGGFTNGFNFVGSGAVAINATNNPHLSLVQNQTNRLRYDPPGPQDTFLDMSANQTVDPLQRFTNPQGPTGIPVGWDFATRFAQFRSIADRLKPAATTNVTGGLAGNQLQLSVAANRLAVFNINQSQLAGLAEVNLTVPSSSILVINVHGAAGGTFPASNFIGGTPGTQNYVLWNFLGAAQNASEPTSFAYTFAASGDFYGSVLAPRADITANRVLDGQIVVRQFTQGGVEVHDGLFLPNLDLVPEPSTYALAAGALALGAAVLRRRALRR